MFLMSEVPLQRGYSRTRTRTAARVAVCSYMYLKEALVGLALVIHLCPGRAPGWPYASSCRHSHDPMAARVLIRE